VPVDNIHLSQKAKDSLIRLKRSTGILNWNVLCRWAYCLSLKEPSVPPDMDHPADSNVEMTWRIFASEQLSDIYWALLRQRCRRDGMELTEENLARQFRLHLHRGIAYLASVGNLPSIAD
jgi:DNA sulfur modification protein DndE